MLNLDSVTFAYPNAETAYNFDLDAGPGEIVLIAGRSGAGKSTLLDLVAGFLAPQSGRITLDGEALQNLPPERRPVSILFQRGNLFDHLSVAKNLELGLPRNMPATERRARIEEALEMTGLAGYGPRRSAGLSGGEQQRVALARTLLRGRPVLLLDEPFTALDQATADTMRALLRRLTDEQHWHVLLVSHDQADATAFANRRYLLEDNRLRED